MLVLRDYDLQQLELQHSLRVVVVDGWLWKMNELQ